jgi:hypothetical protein
MVQWFEILQIAHTIQLTPDSDVSGRGKLVDVAISRCFDFVFSVMSLSLVGIFSVNVLFLSTCDLG